MDVLEAGIRSIFKKHREAISRLDVAIEKEFDYEDMFETKLAFANLEACVEEGTKFILELLRSESSYNTYDDIVDSLNERELFDLLVRRVVPTPPLATRTGQLWSTAVDNMYQNILNVIALAAEE